MKEIPLSEWEGPERIDPLYTKLLGATTSGSRNERILSKDLIAKPVANIPLKEVLLDFEPPFEDQREHSCEQLNERARPNFLLVGVKSFVTLKRSLRLIYTRRSILHDMLDGFIQG